MCVLSKSMVLCSLIITACSSFDLDQKSSGKSEGLVIVYESGKNFVSYSEKAYLDIPQKPEMFKNQIDVEDLRSRQKVLNKDFDRLFFSPWTKKNAKILPAGFRGSYFGENLRKVSKKDSRFIRTNIKYRSSVFEKGIIIRNTMAKIWPIRSQMFSNLKNPGDSYPFDANIQSLMRLGTPVIIRFISNDGLWAFVSSYAFSGWVSRHDVAYVNKNFIKKYMAYTKTVAVKDNIVLTCKGRFLNRADIGTVLPRDKKSLLCPYKNFDGFAKLVRCDASGFVKKPLAFTAENAVNIAKQFVGQKYGWGGYLNLRDCSMLTMDYCTTFGVPIARNGKSQLTQGNHMILPLQNKAKFILNRGRPFLTLVGSKGHVMLYIGEYNNKPVFLHNIWGAPRGSGHKSRYIIGKTVLTSSDFGKDIRHEGNCKLEKIITMIRFI